ncbi:unnamed protein product [Adineta steineri]|uniref:Uncharacterized protein n=1 Tax=Adineta steineri TaxID=433720 RepID=A0A819C8A0_9BILA|nr:unnamed protein product [Adineta steineri]CAF3814521.1 unnamed protein product [Adineta steineri]
MNKSKSSSEIGYQYQNQRRNLTTTTYYTRSLEQLSSVSTLEDYKVTVILSISLFIFLLSILSILLILKHVQKENTKIQRTRAIIRRRCTPKPSSSDDPDGTLLEQNNKIRIISNPFLSKLYSSNPLLAQKLTNETNNSYELKDLNLNNIPLRRVELPDHKLSRQTTVHVLDE